MHSFYAPFDVGICDLDIVKEYSNKTNSSSIRGVLIL